MKIKKLMLLALPVMALSVGIVALNTPKASEEYSTVEAADYTSSNRELTFNDGLVVNKQSNQPLLSKTLSLTLKFALTEPPSLKVSSLFDEV